MLPAARRMRGVCAALTGLLLSLSTAALAQSPRPKPDSAIGEVVTVDASAFQLTMTLDAGGSLRVEATESTPILRAQPGATNLADAKPATFDALVKGDRVYIRGTLTEGGALLKARQIVMMVADDIAQKREAEKADWNRRGIVGTVTATNAATGEITVQLRRFGGAAPLTLTTAGRKVVFKRYSANSVKFSDARASSFAEIQVGDQLRAIGDRNPEGTSLAAEQVVFGTFQTVIGQVETVDAAKGELLMRDDDGKRLTVKVGPDARLRLLPPEFAARLLGRSDAGQGAPSQGQDSARPVGSPPPAAGGDSPARQWRGGGGGGAGGGRGSEDILERLPPTTLGDLKTGGRVLVASAKGTDPTRLNAIALVSGLEILRPANQGGRGGRGGGGDFGGIPSDLMDLGMGGMGGP